MSEPSIPRTLGARAADTREATRDVFGDAAVQAVLGALGPEAREVFEPNANVPEWVPETTFMAWMNAMWRDPCAEDFTKLARWTDRLTDRGFGAVRGMLMSLASPWIILRRANALWRTEHTHGDLLVERLDATSARFVLRNHPFVDDRVAAAAISEAYRYIVHRCRTRGATESHDVSSGALRVDVSWR